MTGHQEYNEVYKLILFVIFTQYVSAHRSQWPRRLRCASAASHLLGLRVRIPPGHGCVSLVNVVCCQVEVSATGRSLI